MPTADTLLIGQTLALDAVVVDQDGDTLPVSVQWATLNPSRAIVDTAGIVTALAAGDVQIVATHGGVGGAAALHVQHSSFSLRFDGSQIATIPDEPALNPSSVMTLEMWVKFDSLDPGQWAVLKDDGTVRQFALGLNGTTSPGPQRRMRAHIRAGGVGGYHTADGATSIPFDTWVHVAQTYDGSVLRLYINGQLDGSTAVNQAMVAEPVDLTFGNNPEGFPLSGNLDEIRLWSVARSQVEIQSTMYTALMGTEPGLVGYWPLEAGSGDVAIDVTANGNQARLGTSVGPDAEDPIWSRDVPRR
jgi:hypothetical protein